MEIRIQAQLMETKMEIKIKAIWMALLMEITTQA